MLLPRPLCNHLRQPMVLLHGPPDATRELLLHDKVYGNGLMDVRKALVSAGSLIHTVGTSLQYAGHS